VVVSHALLFKLLAIRNFLVEAADGSPRDRRLKAAGPEGILHWLWAAPIGAVRLR